MTNIVPLFFSLIPLITNTPLPRTNYFVVFAQNEVGYSEPSKEVWALNVKTQICLRWLMPSNDNSHATNFVVAWSRTSGAESLTNRMVVVGTNMFLDFPPPAPSNSVITYSISWTNLTDTKFFRARIESSTNLLDWDFYTNINQQITQQMTF